MRSLAATLASNVFGTRSYRGLATPRPGPSHPPERALIACIEQVEISLTQSEAHRLARLEAYAPVGLDHEAGILRRADADQRFPSERLDVFDTPLDWTHESGRGVPETGVLGSHADDHVSRHPLGLSEVEAERAVH